ncbi:glycerol-3-phosphate 1-O-acyltransferase PlsY [Hyphomicrobium sp.]|jgi:glycerol-3-phosphate acyltransferase PlsY|uniref:glycerol-3-phosphate 1-O-acyltransferase PlsY n=1 Tax=Hyphomicrobium sp. TaxID=82 RepID=UPI002B8B95A7|nr:glycerol-3-phosphate 1-O-acyltransferase PlsY [Hyphomicrobium sp.]HVZ04573.1 glycerol-3-phosphate 1-O-acyltransferase PlsY [Hyphomicrobium sp.]
MDPSSFPALLIALGLGYLLGSIPSGLILTRLAGLGDVRQIGSGNIGATNVLRTGRKSLAAATLLFDALKGAASALIAWRWFGETAALVAGFGAFLGHVFPIWLGFKGGKGVATFFGVLLAIAWKVGAIFVVVWLAVAGATRISSLAAIAATLASPVAAWALGYREFALVTAVMSAVILIKHRANIRRLLAGEEPKIGATKA